MSASPPNREEVRIVGAWQAAPRDQPPTEEPLLDGVTRAWVWILALAVLGAFAAIGVGIAIG